MKKRGRLATKILGVVLASTLLLVASELFGLWSLVQVHSAYQRLLAVQVAHERETLLLESAFSREGRKWSEVLLHGDDAGSLEATWAAFQESEARCSAVTSRLLLDVTIQQDARTYGLIMQFSVAHQDLVSRYRKAYAAFHESGFKRAAAEAIVGGTEKEPLDIIEKIAEQLRGEQRDVASAVDAASDAAIRRTGYSMLGIAVVGFTLTALVLQRSVVSPIVRLARYSTQVATGDLSLALDLRASNEIGTLAESFGHLVEKLREISKSQSVSIGQLSHVVAEVASSASDQTEAVNSQATALQETQVTAQQIKETSLLAATKAETVLQIAERANELGREGESAVEKSLAGLTEIRAQTEEMAARIRELGERSRQIGGITETVKALADQSNILALNAAIEAVRSGEHGKGFAVVAREIRSLADRSIQATSRVREILESVAASVDDAVAIAERGKQRIEGGLVQVKASGDSLRELSGIVQEASVAARQIGVAVREQNVGISQIFIAVKDQNEMMQTTLERIETVNAAIEVVGKVSRDIAATTSGFTI